MCMCVYALFLIIDSRANYSIDKRCVHYFNLAIVNYNFRERESDIS